MTPPSLITLSLLIVLYALAWHDKPAHQPSNTQFRPDQTDGQPHEEKENT